MTNNPVDIAVSQLERPSGYLMRGGRMHALRLSRFVLAAALAVMLSSAQAQAPLSTFKDCDAGSYLPNAWGLDNMIGNAFEFTEDCASENYQGAPTDGSPWRRGACESFATRSYFFDSMGTGLRSAARCQAVGPDDRSNGLAIRVAVSLDETAWDRRK